MNPTLASLRRDAEPSNKKSRFPAWLIPAGIFGGFVILFVFLFGDRLLPAEEREVRAVLASERPQDESPTASETASESRGEGATAFQASGWIEPDPLPVRATALINGVVDQVHVLEGDLVEEGQVLATLIRQDFDLALATARQDRRMREAAVETQRQAVRVARESLRGARANLELAAATVEETEDRKQRVDRLSRGAIAEA
jgi:multidrug efflux pump subunit AcrA (membrane-fusion protein)